MDIVHLYGYRIPNPCRSSDEYERVHCQDLETLSRTELRAERVALLAALGMGGSSALRAQLMMPSTYLGSVPFVWWAESRIAAIDRILGYRPQGAGPAPVVCDPDEA